MSQATTQKTALDSIRIIDPEVIKKIQQEIPEPFIPKFEDGTYDEEVLDEGRYTNSAEEIGGQYIPVAVAYCVNDPVLKKKLEDGKPNPDYNPESVFRVNGRIIDGRHRWLDSVSHGKKWKIDYFHVKDYTHYMSLRKHLDQKKKASKTENDNFFEQYCKYVYEVEGVPIEDVGKIVVDRFKNTMPQSTIRPHIPKQFKNQKMRSLRLDMKKNIEDTVVGKKIKQKLEKKTTKELSKKDKAIEKLHVQIDDDIKKIMDLETQMKVHDEVMKEYEDIQPFLNAVHKIKVDGANIEVEVSLNVTKKEIKVKKV